MIHHLDELADTTHATGLSVTIEYQIMHLAHPGWILHVG